MCLQETRLWPHSNFWLKGFQTVRKDIVSSNQSGICMLVRDNLVFSEIDLSNFNHSSWEIQGISLSMRDDMFAIINIYRHSNQNTPFSIIALLFSFLSKNYFKFIIVGDLNAHHFWWGCTYEDTNGKTLSRAIEANNLIILNDRSSPTLLHPSAKHSIIDLVLASENAALLCCSYTILDTMGSDHFPVCTTIDDNFYVKNVFLYKLRINNNDLDSLYHSLCNSIDNLKNLISDTNDNPPLAYTYLESHIKNHLYSFFPPGSRYPRSRSSRQKPLSPPWWNEKCQSAISERKESVRRYLAHPSPANYLAYKRSKSQCSKILKKQKKLGWKKYCTLFDHKTPTSEIWHLIKNFTKRENLLNPPHI